jgi:xanthine/uracil permease
MIQTILFVAGLNTLFQSFFGTRLPAVIGASYSYVPTTISIILAARYSDILNPQEVGSLESHLVWCFPFFFLKNKIYYYYLCHNPGSPDFLCLYRNLKG